MKPSKAARVEFNDRLIAEVQKRPVLWDCCRPDYKDQRKKMTAWEEVAAECGRDPDGELVVLAVLVRWSFSACLYRSK